MCVCVYIYIYIYIYDLTKQLNISSLGPFPCKTSLNKLSLSDHSPWRDC